MLSRFRHLERMESQAAQQTAELQKKAKQATFLTSKAKEYRKQINALEVDYVLFDNQILELIFLCNNL